VIDRGSSRVLQYGVRDAAGRGPVRPLDSGVPPTSLTRRTALALLEDSLTMYVANQCCTYPTAQMIDEAGLAPVVRPYDRLVQSHDGRVWAVRTGPRGSARQVDVFSLDRGYVGWANVRRANPVALLSDGAHVRLLERRSQPSVQRSRDLRIRRYRTSEQPKNVRYGDGEREGVGVHWKGKDNAGSQRPTDAARQDTQRKTFRPHRSEAHRHVEDQSSPHRPIALILVALVDQPGSTRLASACDSTGSSSSCGTCCYGDFEEIQSCCVDNGCTAQCELVTSFCCPGGYQLSGCYAS
jgi:hypothetical protein